MILRATYRQFLSDSLLGHCVASRSRRLHGKRVEYPVAAIGVPPQHRGISAKRRIRGGVRAIHENDAPPPYVGTPRRVVERAQLVCAVWRIERLALFSVQVCAHKRHNFPYLWRGERCNLDAATFPRCIYLLFPLLLFNTAETRTAACTYAAAQNLLFTEDNE